MASLRNLPELGSSCCLSGGHCTSASTCMPLRQSTMAICSQYRLVLQCTGARIWMASPGTLVVNAWHHNNFLHERRNDST
ncbi:hypothetical protein OH76DRAFT_291204 [Lentinus brumalis]|uniref:Uncharacterized protein n=1 Tax=Lentinus brumalis TaxID=2498619 RepID=A0A371DG09_9APHY|nr:hypothetical protein OH76DRAFT_291204 [Polyporus brumalis]